MIALAGLGGFVWPPVDPDPLFDGGQFQLGNRSWTAPAVQRDADRRLAAPGEGEARYLVRRSGG